MTGLGLGARVVDESSKEITVAYSLPEARQLWAVGYILGRLPGSPNPRSVTALCKCTEEGMARCKGVVSHVCARGNSTGGRSFREETLKCQKLHKRERWR